MRALVWLARAAVFFVLFAFALNNQHESTIRWFFGTAWRAPTVFIVLAAFALGCAFGIVSMVPSWWKHRRVARRVAPLPAPAPTAPASLGEEPGGRAAVLDPEPLDPPRADVPRALLVSTAHDGR